MRDAVEKNKKMEEKQAVELIDRCMKLLFYRDARSLNKVSSVTRDASFFQRRLGGKAKLRLAVQHVDCMQVRRHFFQQRHSSCARF